MCRILDILHGRAPLQTQIYGMACIFALLLRSINPNSKWKDQFKGLIYDFPNSKIISLKSAGFPDDWGKANLGLSEINHSLRNKSENTSRCNVASFLASDIVAIVSALGWSSRQ